MQVWHFLFSVVIVGTVVPVIVHYSVHGVLLWYHVALCFFCTLNSLIALWEIALGLYIQHIRSTYIKLQKSQGVTRMQHVLNFFFAPLPLRDALSFKYWGRVWSTYSLYDPSYSNQESFGFFIDVGNGWTTLLPSLLAVLCATFDLAFLNARLVALVCLLTFYQEMYGTVIYFLSFIFNRRYAGKGFLEVGLFVGITNGLWFFFPLLGMKLSYDCLLEGSFQLFRGY